ncbi:hypothetical protein EIP91_008762 [Steccherinum ochraceum]|uniref:Protein kinase domain-containing protein n=1 Tax=Steccherinum ochraceum TaxID=92696 RepID=A0A4V2MV64_9APHY|nr:hypothetical protein EIP91_008762 [Steccherinum ochraceum]
MEQSNPSRDCVDNSQEASDVLNAMCCLLETSEDAWIRADLRPPFMKTLRRLFHRRAQSGPAEDKFRAAWKDAQAMLLQVDSIITELHGRCQESAEASMSELDEIKVRTAALRHEVDTNFKHLAVLCRQYRRWSLRGCFSSYSSDTISGIRPLPALLGRIVDLLGITTASSGLFDGQMQEGAINAGINGKETHSIHVKTPVQELREIAHTLILSLSTALLRNFSGIQYANPGQRSALDIFVKSMDFELCRYTSARRTLLYRQLSLEQPSSPAESHELSRDFLEILHQALSKADISTLSEDVVKEEDLFASLLSLSRTLRSLPSSYYLVDVFRTSNASPRQSGGFGDVYKATWQGQDVALKVLRVFGKDLLTSSSSSSQVDPHLVREVVIWRHIKHPNVQEFFGVDEVSFAGRLAMVSKWQPHGNVKEASLRLELSNVAAYRPQWVQEIAAGLAYLHSRGVVHGDLRGDNVLVDDAWHARLTDFGLTTLVDASTLTNGSAGGLIPLAWAAPELLEETCSRPTFACDVFSFGRTCVELYSGAKPFVDLNDLQGFQKILAGEHPARPIDAEPVLDDSGSMVRLASQPISDQFWDLLLRCWSVNPAGRPSAPEVVAEIGIMVLS